MGPTAQMGDNFSLNRTLQRRPRGRPYRTWRGRGCDPASRCPSEGARPSDGESGAASERYNPCQGLSPSITPVNSLKNQLVLLLIITVLSHAKSSIARARSNSKSSSLRVPPSLPLAVQPCRSQLAVVKVQICGRKRHIRVHYAQVY